jgi:hypothetical protein
MGPQYLETATTVPLLFGILACVILERYLPYSAQWKPVSSDWKIDTAFLFIFQTIFPKIFKCGTAISIAFHPRSYHSICRDLATTLAYTCPGLIDDVYF